MKKVPTREAADRTLQEREEAEESWERFQKTADSQKLRQEHASKSSVKSKADKERLTKTIASGILNRRFGARLERAKGGEARMDKTVILPITERDESGNTRIVDGEAEILEADWRLLNHVKDAGRFVPLEPAIPFATVTTEDRQHLRREFPAFKETEAQDLFALQFAQEESCEAFHHGDVAPLIRHARTYGPLLFIDLADEGVNNLPWMLVELYVSALSGHRAARKNYQTLLKALGTMWRGNYAKRPGFAAQEQDDREISKKKKRRHDARDRAAKEKISQVMHAEYEKATKTRNPHADHRRLRSQIKDDVLARFLNSPDAAERRAAKQIQQKKRTYMRSPK